MGKRQTQIRTNGKKYPCVKSYKTMWVFSEEGKRYLGIDKDYITDGYYTKDAIERFIEQFNMYYKAVYILFKDTKYAYGTGLFHPEL